MFAQALAEKTSHISVHEENGAVIGFCKIDVHEKIGKLDYLVVQEEYRGRGYGKDLMDWAMQSFDQYGVQRIEVKVVDGNDAINLYQKYGFQVNAHILVKNQ